MPPPGDSLTSLPQAMTNLHRLNPAHKNKSTNTTQQIPPDPPLSGEVMPVPTALTDQKRPKRPVGHCYSQ
jgi:hypothetical protein